MSTTKITVPTPINEQLTFRWFVEYAIDTSPKFQRASAIAKMLPLLQADLDTPGEHEVDTVALEFLRAALLDDEVPFELPQLSVSAKDPDGNATGEPQPLSPRIFLAYVKALVS